MGWNEFFSGSAVVISIISLWYGRHQYNLSKIALTDHKIKNDNNNKAHLEFSSGFQESIGWRSPYHYIEIQNTGNSVAKNILVEYVIGNEKFKLECEYIKAGGSDILHFDLSEDDVFIDEVPPDEEETISLGVVGYFILFTVTWEDYYSANNQLIIPLNFARDFSNMYGTMGYSMQYKKQDQNLRKLIEPEYLP